MKQSVKALIVCLLVVLLATAWLAARPALASGETVAPSAPWSSPNPVASGLADATNPVVVHGRDGVMHALWESGGKLFYASRPPGGRWSEGQRMAYGITPALAVDSRGQLHAIFANQFFGNYEIYHCRFENGAWSLPTNVARTSGVSMSPALAAGSDGALHAAWMDNSPGYWTIYAATYKGHFWSNEPIPNGRGQSPAIAVTKDNKVILAWQDRIPTLDNPTGFFNIFLSEWQGVTWGLPVNISDQNTGNAIGVSLTATSDGMAHMVWAEGMNVIRYDFGQGSYWPSPQTVIQTPVIARGPRIAAGQGDILHIAWDEGEVLRLISAPKMPPSWPKPQVVTALQGTLTDVGLAVQNGALGSGVTLSWVQVSQTDNVEIYESHYRLETHEGYWLPMIVFSGN